MPLLPGAQGVVYDKALRGTHIDDAGRRLGWLVQTGVPDVRNAKDNPIEWHIEDVDVERADGITVTLSVYAREGAAGLRELTETGEPFFVPLERIKTERRGRPGRYRFYNVYRLPPAYGGGELRLVSPATTRTPVVA